MKSKTQPVTIGKGVGGVTLESEGVEVQRGFKILEVPKE